MHLQLRRHRLDLSVPVVMGVLNVTPDSFSDGGRHADPEAALARARAMVDEGARIVDVGGESTRPGAEPVSEAQELDRVLPVIEAIAGGLDVAVSVDTMKPAVMREACRLGAELVNDVYALRASGATDAVRGSGAAACLMHMQGEPRSMQREPRYDDVVSQVRAFLADRVEHCVAAGIARDRLLIDPGFGFGKTLEHNLQLLARLEALRDLGCPILVGLSRKSMFGQLLGLPLEARLQAGIAAAVLAVWQGASVVRTHDVRATVEALGLVDAVRIRRGKV